MANIPKPPNVISLPTALLAAERGRYAAGSFSPRYTAMIRPILQSAAALFSPVIVQISAKELLRYGISVYSFAEEFYRQVTILRLSVPTVLHLDHTKDVQTIREAITAGFTSVMIDASELPLHENIAATKTVVEYAHERNVSVEAELGHIGTTDFIETDHDREMYTDPEEAAFFAATTGADALAVSVGTAHGVYTVRQPAIDYERLKAIRAKTRIPLVLHGGSGVPAEMIRAAITLPGGGVSKVNIATDLEVAALDALQRKERLSDAEMSNIPADRLETARRAVAEVASEKMRDFLFSAGKAEGEVQRCTA